MADCEKYIEQISALVDGELDPRQEAELRAHIDSCPDCRRVYDAFSAISGALGEELAEPPEMLAKGVMFKIKASKGKGAERRFSFGRFTAIAACAAVIIFAAARFMPFLGAGNSAPPPASAYSANAGGTPDQESASDIRVPYADVDPSVPPTNITEPTGGESEGDSTAPKFQDEESVTQFGNGLSELPDLTNSYVPSVLSDELTQLLCNNSLALYRGRPSPVDIREFSELPYYTITDQTQATELLTLLGQPQEPVEEEPLLPNGDPLVTISILVDKTQDPEAKDRFLAIWSTDKGLVCLLTGDNEDVLFNANGDMTALQEFLRKLTPES